MSQRSIELSAEFEAELLKATGASGWKVREVIQNLWSGYGKILRIELTGAEYSSVVAKHVAPPTAANHPRGWNTDRSHQRKLRSYEVEAHWYEQWSRECDSSFRLPKYLGGVRRGSEMLFILEDLDVSGYPGRLDSLTDAQLGRCLSWLACFHARFLGASPDGLWEVGSYWHLATRPEELEALADQNLKSSAAEIDRRLTAARFKSLVHGDAKVANFCFAEETDDVAMVDFQYVGGGCGMKDLAYFLGSCLDEASCELREGELLDRYFAHFQTALAKYHPDVDGAAVEEEWRALFPFAWTDFHRFLKGWSPGHWKLTGYSERLAAEVLQSLHET